MRVLYLTMNPNRASTTVPTEGWFRELRSKGLEPVLASKELGSFHAWTAAQGIPAFHVEMPVPSEFSKTRLIAPLWRLRRLVKRFGVQIIHSNEQDLYPVAPTLPLGIQARAAGYLTGCGLGPIRRWPYQP